jgi:hypothetical protein
MEFGRRRVTQRTHWLGGYLGKGAISFVATLLGNSIRPLRIFFLRCFCFSLTYSAACMLDAVVMRSYTAQPLCPCYSCRCWRRKIRRRLRSRKWRSAAGGSWSRRNVAGINICDSSRSLNCTHTTKHIYNIEKKRGDGNIQQSLLCRRIYLLQHFRIPVYCQLMFYNFIHLAVNK